MANVSAAEAQEREFEHHIYAYDCDMKAVNTASMNVRAAGLSKDVTVAQQDFKDFTQPAEKSIIVMNPPYGERISTPNLLGTYKMIGERLKHAFEGNEAWILSYREECFEQIGLKPSIKIPVYNGSLECEFRKYAMFGGKMREFRAEGGIVKTDEEKREMAQKHRFKKEREFKKRISEETENEGADIRSFQFHTNRMENFEKRREEIRTGRRFDRDRDDDRRGGFKGGKRFGDRDRNDDKRGGFKGGKRFGDRDDKRGGFKGKRFGDRNDKRGGFKGKRDFNED